MFVCVKPKFERPKSPEIVRKLDMSYQETINLKFRPIYCPHCNIHVIDFFEDMIGHLAFKCPNCKGTVLINAAYFHRSDAAAKRKRFQIKRP